MVARLDTYPAGENDDLFYHVVIQPYDKGPLIEDLYTACNYGQNLLECI
jgi:hypothetical protein